MTLIIVAILLIGYILIATEKITNVNKAAVAMLMCTVGWVLYICYGNDFIFEPKGTIVRLTPPLPPLDKYLAGIRFHDVDAATRQKIIRYIFGKQAEMRMKEKKWFE